MKMMNMLRGGDHRFEHGFYIPLPITSTKSWSTCSKRIVCLFVCLFVCFFLRPFSCLGNWFLDSIESIEFRFPVSDSIEGLS